MLCLVFLQWMQEVEVKNLEVINRLLDIMGYKRNEYNKKKSKHLNPKKNRKRYEENENILLQRMQEFNRSCYADS